MEGFIALSTIITNELEDPSRYSAISLTCPRSRVIDGSLHAELLPPDKVPGAQRLRCSVAHAIVPAGDRPIPGGRSQYIRNTGTGDLVFLCIGTPKWQAADEELA